MREVVHSIAVPIIIGLGWYVVETFTDNDDVSNSVFMLVNAVLLHIVSREVAWLLKYYWRKKKIEKGTLDSEPREADKNDYLFWFAIHISLMGIVFIILFFILRGLSLRENNPYFPILTAIAVGLGVAITTGDCFSGGLIAAFEFWSLYMREYRSSQYKLVLLCIGGFAFLFSVLHAVRTVAAVTGRDKAYLSNLKNVRWGWDEHSARVYTESNEIVLATVTMKRPFILSPENKFIEHSESVDDSEVK